MLMTFCVFHFAYPDSHRNLEQAETTRLPARMAFAHLGRCRLPTQDHRTSPYAFVGFSSEETRLTGGMSRCFRGTLPRSKLRPVKIADRAAALASGPVSASDAEMELTDRNHAHRTDRLLSGAGKVPLSQINWPVFRR
jgi:hypothetical protein